MSDSVYEYGFFRMLRESSAEMDRLRNELDESQRKLVAWMANIDEPQEIDASDLEAIIAAARTQGRDSIRISARDLWRMASDKRGREEE